MVDTWFLTYRTQVHEFFTLKCVLGSVSLEIVCFRIITLNVLEHTLKSSIQTFKSNMRNDVEYHFFLENGNK